jgi:hypothetical protein
MIEEVANRRRKTPPINENGSDRTGSLAAVGEIDYHFDSVLK